MQSLFSNALSRLFSQHLPLSASRRQTLAWLVFGERDMPLEGIIVARSKDGKGTYVLAGLNIATELELDYSGTCTLPKP
jgi:hypothetical protein